MRKTVMTLVVATLLGPSLAEAQGAVAAEVQLRLGLPVVLPQLVVVAPGVQVVPEVEHEVFFADGWYWVRQDNGWYRSRSHRGGWVLVGPRAVPARLSGLPPGKYRHWKAAKEEHKERRKERREEAREDRKEAREHAKEHRKHGKH